MYRYFYCLLIGLCPLLSYAQNALNGQLLSPEGEPLVGVQVEIDPGQQQSLTDANGRFRFENPPQESVRLTVKSKLYQYVQDIPFPFPESVVIRIVPRLQADEVIVRSTRVRANDPVSHSQVTGEEMERINVGQDVPFLLRWTPSMVVTSDAGTGIGYTYLRIRGSDQTRINVTINGIPLNDAESQQVFWVDLPDLAGSTDDVQIQRGLGSSTNGPGAFGATINLNTNKVDTEAGGSIQAGLGSFGTWRMRLEGHTGLINGQYFGEARVSRIHSEGYIDRARADLKSFYVSAGRVTDRSMLKFNVFGGAEVTYQAWYGVPAQYIDDPDLRTYNVAGTLRPGAPYSNEVDDYGQTHYQAFYTLDMGDDWTMSLSGNYTRGKGFYENYRSDTADYLRRLWLDNHFYGVAPSLQWKDENDRDHLVLGGGLFLYDGLHFGERRDVDGSLLDVFYENEARKTDANIYAKYTRRLGDAWRLWADMQFRHVQYDFEGLNRQGVNTDQSISLPFFNPKLGVSYDFSGRSSVYGFAGLGQREPNRDDFTESSPASRPKAEAMLNLESGWRIRGANWNSSLNAYGMFYRDQLVQTGQLNDVGAATRINVDRSYRIGLEWQGNWSPRKKWLLDWSANLSRNRILDLALYFDDWDTGEQFAVLRSETPISYSPDQIAHLSLRYYLLGDVRSRENHQLSIEWSSKWVGAQYLDNSGDPEARLDGYSFTDISVMGFFPLKRGQGLAVKLLVQNALNQDVVSNGWIYRFSSQGYNPVPDDPYAVGEQGDRYQLRGLFPQAGINVMGSIAWNF
jgi:iron complex outermembrane recepter protein